MSMYDGEGSIGDQGPAAEPANALAAPAVHSGGINREQSDKLLRWADPQQTNNIAEELDEDRLNKIGGDVRREYDIDCTSRSDWLDNTKDAMKLAMQVAEKKVSPWDGASNVIYPLMTMAAIEFAARAYPAIVAGRNIVKGVVCGDDDGVPAMSPQDGTPMVQMGQNGQPQPVWQVEPGVKQARADRIAEHMSYQLIEEQEEWEEEEDKLLHILPIVGCIFRKSYFDPQWGRNMSLMVTAENLVVNYGAKSMELAPRISEELKLYPYEIEESKRADIFLNQDYNSSNSSEDKDAPHDLIEQHRRIDLDEDGYAEPYIVTLHKDSSKVCRIVARYDPDGVHFSMKSGKVAKIEPIHYYTKFDFLPNMEGGIYGMGFGQLLKPINESVNTSLNMLFDAGTRQNQGGGFIGRGLSMHSGSVKFKMGEYKVVNAPGAKIRDAIVHLEQPGPSPVLFQLLGMLIEAGKDVARVKDILSGDAKAQTMQPTTLLALIEQGLKVFTGIYKRVHRSHKSEFNKLFRLNRIYLQDQTSYRYGDDWKKIKREDYEKAAGVEPISDPTMVSDMQQLGRAQFLQGYQNDPLCNPIEVRRRVFEAAKIPNVDKILMKEMPQQGPDPKIVIAAHKMELDTITAKASALNSMTGAILNLANADKAVGDTHLGWLNHELDKIKLQIEAMNAAQQPGPEGGEPQPEPQQGAAPNMPGGGASPLSTNMPIDKGPMGGAVQ